MRRNLRRPALWAVVALLGSTPAAAQSLPGISTGQGIPAGPVRLALGFELRDAGLDTNILRQTDGQVPDGVATAQTYLTASMRTGPVRVTSPNAVGFDYFARYRDQRSLNRDHQLRVDAHAGPVAFFVSGTYRNVRERYNYDLESRVWRQESSGSAGAELRLTAKTSIGTDLRHAYVTFQGNGTINDVPIEPVMQHHVDEASARLRYKLTRLTTLSLGGEVERIRFAQSPVRDSNSFRVLPGIEFQPAALIAGTATIGYQSFEPLTLRFPRFSGIVGAADLSIPIALATRLRVGAQRDLQYSYQIVDPMYVLTGARAAIVQRVADRWELEAGTEQQRLAYRALTPIAADDLFAQLPSRVDHRRLYRTSMTYIIDPMFRLGVESEYVHRDSDITTRRFEQLRVGVFLRYGVVR